MSWWQWAVLVALAAGAACLFVVRPLVTPVWTRPRKNLAYRLAQWRWRKRY